MKKAHSFLFAPPFRDFDGRETLRSLRDALDKLRELDGLSDSDTVEVRTSELRVGDGRVSGLVLMLGPARSDGCRWVIRMPSSARFTAKTTLGTQQTYDISLLDRAVSDAEGNVELANGLFVHEIDLIPAPFFGEATWRDELIVRLAAKFLRVHSECYRPLHQQLLPRVRRLRYDAVAQIGIDRLKPVIRYIAEHRVQHHLAQPITSASVIAKALARAGMKLPRSTRHSPP
jgi:hypothetical protein